MPYEIQRPTKRLRSWALASGAALSCIGAAAVNATPAMADGTPVMPNGSPAAAPRRSSRSPSRRSTSEVLHARSRGERRQLRRDRLDAARRRERRDPDAVGGSTGNVVDLPSGAVAISPLTCVNVSYVSAPGDGQRRRRRRRCYFVSYPGIGGNQFGAVTAASPGAGWSLSDPWQLNPPGDGDWVRWPGSTSSRPAAIKATRFSSTTSTSIRTAGGSWRAGSVFQPRRSNDDLRNDC